MTPNIETIRFLTKRLRTYYGRMMGTIADAERVVAKAEARVERWKARPFGRYASLEGRKESEQKLERGQRRLWGRHGR
jgi:hypothetical protein